MKKTKYMFRRCPRSGVRGPRSRVKGQKSKVKNIKLLIFILLTLNIGHWTVGSLSCQQFQEIEVKAGDTLWGVANYYLKEPSKWPEILKFNNISTDPNNVLPGIKLKIPVMLIKEQLRSSSIVSVVREVKIRRQIEVDWLDAKANMKLYNKDGIRTFENSSADVRSPLGNLMTIGPSSLVIVQPEDKSDETRLLSGEIRTTNIPIRTPTAFVMPKITAKTPVADYKTKVKEDQSTVVAVYKGAVDVSAKNKTVTVMEGFSTEVKINLPPMEPKRLPPTLDLSGMPASKENNQQIKSNDINPIDIKDKPADIKKDKIVNEINVGGELSKAAAYSSLLDIAQYHIQIAKDKEFNSVIYDSVRPIYDKFDIKKTDVPDGKYFWRVAYLDSSGAEGILSFAKEIYVDKTPPVLTVDEPKDNIKFSDDSITVKGSTELGALVDINGFYVSITKDGKFSGDVSLLNGENTIKINSKDDYGNISTVSLKVYRTEEGTKQRRRKFFSTPVGVILSIITITALMAISIVTIGGG
ncbi:MAG: LysM peptidoglycan-binding domain-containing protein [Elusimicrobia bacterium]|nr:LysM peptidoglycan-binding domain-containing protein [Elusimicrobiota bacterium]